MKGVCMGLYSILHKIIRNTQSRIFPNNDNLPTIYRDITFDNIKAVIGNDCQKYQIESIIRYNKTFRDYLRSNGMDQLIHRIIERIPQFAMTPELFSDAKEWFDESGLANYDVIRLPINCKIHLLGCKFNGLDGLRKSVTHSVSFSCIQYANSDIDKAQPECCLPNINVLELYERYPCFDSDDYATENRFFRNYIVTQQDITPQLLRQIVDLETNDNYDLCTEKIPAELLPIVYYPGEGRYMFIATNERL